MTQKVASFEWDLKQKAALQQVQVAVQAALPLGQYDPADLVVLELPVADRDAVCSLWQATLGQSQRRLWDLGARLYCHLNTVISPLRDNS